MTQPVQSFIQHGFQIHHYNSLDSTQDKILQQLTNGQIKMPTAIWADQQTAGRGRSKGEGENSSWHSPPGNLYISIAVPIETEKIVPILNFVPILALNQVLAEQTKRFFHLKWPNDLYLDGKKLAGVLFQPKADWLICGLGCNISQVPFSEEISAIATSLSQVTGQSYDISKILEPLLEQWSYWLQIYQDSPTDLLAAWKRLDNSLGHGVRIKTLEGKELLGIAKDLTTDGFLVLTTSTGDIVITEGTLRYMD